MSEVHPITFRLKVFNAWRRGNDAPQPDPKTVGEDIDSICDVAKRLERERDAERILADRLAEALEGIWPFIEEDIPHGCNSTAYMNAIELCRANITAWKEARSE